MVVHTIGAPIKTSPYFAEFRRLRKVVKVETHMYQHLECVTSQKPRQTPLVAPAEQGVRNDQKALDGGNAAAIPLSF